MVEVLMAVGLFMLMLGSCLSAYGYLFLKLEQKQQQYHLQEAIESAVIYLKGMDRERLCNLAQQSHQWDWDGETLPLGVTSVEPLYQVTLTDLNINEQGIGLEGDELGRSFLISVYHYQKSQWIGYYVFFY
jgi:hypothetical protein